MVEQALLLLAKKIDPHFCRIEKLPQSGSNRQYFRIFAEKETIIAVFNHDVKENNESFFCSFTLKRVSVLYS